MARRDPRWKTSLAPIPRQRLWTRQARLWQDLLPEPGIADGPLQLLRTARSLFIQSRYDFDFLMVAILVANQAVEAAFRVLYPEPEDARFQILIDSATADGHIGADLAEVAHDIRKMRNLLSHPLGQADADVLATVNLLGFAHEIVAGVMLAAERSCLVAPAK